MKLQFLVIHCTATPEGRAVSKQDIIRMHTSAPPEGRGWKKVGYSDLITLEGSLVNLTPYNQDDEVDAWEITNGVRGYNSISRHIVYAGGCDKQLNPKNTLTKAQHETLKAYVLNLITLKPAIKIAGHYQFDAGKACPSFDVPMYLRAIGVPEKNIYKKGK
jgi:hypothetical protein